jgi:putative PIG3 family NAD(P)H quinone oxidoreductase
MAETMIAVSVQDGGGPPEALKPIVVPRPQPTADQILIKVAASGLNGPEVRLRRGTIPWPPSMSRIMGIEVSGEVVEAAGRWKVGDQVCALLSGGGYAEYVACDARHALPVPRAVDLVAAAALPEGALTVYANLFEHGALRPGETVMVHAGTSGIGVMAIQMAKAAGARVIATGRGAGKASQALALGADIAIDVTTQDFADVAKAAGGVDVVLDMVAGDYLRQDLQALNMGGRVVFISFVGGGEASLSIFEIMRKGAVVTGSTLLSRAPDEKARLVSEIERRVWPWIEAGAIRPIIDSTFPLADAAGAHRRLESGAHVGKVVLKVGSP